MGAPKRIWQLLKALALVLGITVSGLTILLTYDMANAFSPSSFQTVRDPSFTDLNATHYHLKYTVNITNRGLIYSFGYNISIYVYVNTTAEESFNQTPLATFMNGTILSPGESFQLIVEIIIGKHLWDDASSFILALKNTFTGILFSKPVTSIGMEVFDQLI